MSIEAAGLFRAYIQGTETAPPAGSYGIVEFNLHLRVSGLPKRPYHQLFYFFRRVISPDALSVLSRAASEGLNLYL